MTTIERFYLYLNMMERRLKEQWYSIDREGDNYSIGWSLLLRAIDLLYKCFFIVLHAKAIAEGFAFGIFTLINRIVFIRAYSIYFTHDFVVDLFAISRQSL